MAALSARDLVSVRDIFERLSIESGSILYVASDVIRLALNYARHGVKYDSNNLIEILQKKVGRDGTLIFPTFNIGDFAEKQRYDIRSADSETGVLGKACLLRDDFERTWNPMHSFAVWGKLKDEIVGLRNINSFGADSPFAYLNTHNGQMLMIDVDYNKSMTFIHYVEAQAKVPYRQTKEYTGVYIDKDGNKSDVTVEYPLVKPEYQTKKAFNRMGTLLESKGVAKVYKANDIPFRVINLPESYPYIYGDLTENMAAKTYDFNVPREEIYKDYVKPQS